MIEADPVPTIEEDASEGARQIATRMRSVLVVEDDPFVRDIVKLWVRGVGYQPRHAETAEAALDELHREPAGVAICDINLPARDGVWLASRIREAFLPTTAIVKATCGIRRRHRRRQPAQ